MKMKKIRALFILVCIGIILLSGCGGETPKNKKADDAISKAIYDAMGTHDVRYTGKEYLEDGHITRYNYYICNAFDLRKNVFGDIILVANETIENEDIENKIQLSFWTYIGGAGRGIAAAMNYSEMKSEKPDYPGLQHLQIYGSRMGLLVGKVNNDIDNPDVYKDIQDVKCLKVTKEFNFFAENQGIDWYEYWPDIEKFEVYQIDNLSEYYYPNHEPNDFLSQKVFEAIGDEDLYYCGKTLISKEETRYEYYIRNDKNVTVDKLIQTVNKLLEEKEVTKKISITFWKEESDEVQNVFTLRNYSEDSLDEPDCKGMNYLCIHGSQDIDDSIYNNPSTFQFLKGIQYLEVRQKIQQVADEQGIDWYHYWPELQKVGTFNDPNDR